MQNFFTNRQKNLLAKAVIAIVVLFGIFLVIEFLYVLKSFSYIGYNPNNVIVVTGKGEVLAVPDVATFSFTVSETGKTISEAQSKASPKINAAIAAVKSFGIADTDIKTISYNSYPTYSYTNYPCPLINTGSSAVYPCRSGKQTITGYQVDQTIQVKIRKTEIAGDVLAKIGGLDVSNISSLDFTVDKPDILQDQARDKAIADAKQKAQKISESLNIDLRRIVRFEENNNQPIFYAQAMSNTAVPLAPQIPAGQNSFTSNVAITYEVD